MPGICEWWQDVRVYIYILYFNLSTLGIILFSDFIFSLNENVKFNFLNNQWFFFANLYLQNN